MNVKHSALIITLLSFFSTHALGAEFPLRYDQPLVEQGFTSPVIKVSVNGTSGLFLVDSGASVSVVSSWFAEKAGIQDLSSGTVGGASGGSDASKMAKLDLSLTSSIGEAIVYKGKVVAIASLPEVFHTNGIAGILSPQQLLKENEVCRLELKTNPSMTFQESRPTPQSKYLPLSIVTHSGPEGTQTALYTLEGRVEGFKTHFIVDTGANEARIGFETSPGTHLLPQSIPTNEKVGGITGKPEFVRLLPHAKVKLLDRSLRMNVRLQPISNQMPADGMLGMEFLKNCSLIFSLNYGSIYCQ